MPTTRSRRRVTWSNLGERTRLMLQRLNDSILLSENDLCALVWPEAVSRQARTERLARWLAEQYIQPIAIPDGRGYQLGRNGARLLREAGFPRLAPVRPVAERVHPGLLLANQFGVALHEDIRTDLGISGMGWMIRPFSGSDARGDGIAAIGYDLDGLPAQRTWPVTYAPEYLGADYTPPPGFGIMRLVVEIDSGSEDARQLAQRARNWRTRWDQTTWPPATHTIFLWITDQGWLRLETIWSAWTQHALLPAFFTTVETLTLGTGTHWHPWNPRRYLPDGRSVWVWHDMEGRPRSLRPWDLEEGVVRFEQPRPVSRTRFQVDSPAWDGW
ncbi:hypothetical protein EYB53_011265 [Candidatus Chloroploca sp. M-50]|uniref:Uncharacterized protein n=1 Tax=Candidatus Chloroploca mongolica TaxID=2528176 RepID=A0ABS4DA18_9CHLR|nr:hypothetical protein [Candidatus Chloroploca mongolica]MBP1466285.1 hypothetical protein [Candidatus Chloroploca mongolica]